MTHVEGQQAPPDHTPASPATATATVPAWLPHAGAGPTGPTAAATAGTGLPLGLTPDDLRDGGLVVLRSFGPVLAVLTVLVAAVGTTGLPDEFGGSLADWLRTAVLLLALSMGGALGVDGSMGSSDLSLTLDLGLRAIPLTVTVAVLLLVARAARAVEALRPSDTPRRLWARSGATGLVAGLATAVATLFASTSEAFGVDIVDELDLLEGAASLGASPLSSALGATVVVTLAGAVGRTRVSPHLRPARIGAFAAGPQGAGVRAVAPVLRTFVVGLVAVAAVVVVLAFLHRLLLTEDLEDVRLASVVAALLLVANAVAGLVLAALGVPLGYDVTVAGRFDVPLFDLDDLGEGASGSLGLSGTAWLVLLVPVLVALATAVRRSLRDFRGPASPQELRSAALVGAVTAFAAALLVSVWASGELSGSAQLLGGSAGGAAEAAASGGPSPLWAALLGAAWAAAAVWAVRLGPTLALSLPPAVARAVAGRGIRPEWAAALAGTGPAPAGQPSAALRRGAVVAAVLAVLAGVSAAAIAAVNAFLLTPAAAAEDYLDAVADRDLARVAAQLGETPDLADQPLLAAGVLGSDAFTPIAAVSVGATEELDGYARVDVTYAVGDERREDTVSLRQGEDRFGFFRTWEVDESLPTVALYSESGLRFEVAGDRVPDGDWLALPGRYTVAAGDHPILTAADTGFSVTTDAAESPALRATVQPGAKEKAEAAVEERLADCATRTVLPLDDCPFLNGYGVPDDAYDVQIAITQAPEWSLTYDESISGFRIEGREYGEVSYSYDYIYRGWFGDRAEEESWSDEDEFWLYGSVTTAGDEFDVVFD